MTLRGLRSRVERWARPERWPQPTGIGSRASSSLTGPSAGFDADPDETTLKMGSARFPAGTVCLVTRLCGMHMEWLLGPEQLAQVSAVAEELLAIGRFCEAPVADVDAVYGGLLIDLDAETIPLRLLHVLNGAAFGQCGNGTWRRIDSGVAEAVAFTAVAGTSLAPAVDWIRGADRNRGAFWSPSSKPYPPCPDPHSGYVELVPAR